MLSRRVARQGNGDKLINDLPLSRPTQLQSTCQKFDGDSVQHFVMLDPEISSGLTALKSLTAGLRVSESTLPI